MCFTFSVLYFDVFTDHRSHNLYIAILSNFIGTTKVIPQSTRCSENTTPLKEVIQPHVLVRLPCYDFTPVIRIALDASLPCGLGQRFQALQTPMV